MYFVLKRIFDITASILVLSVLSPLFIFVAIWILLDSPGGVFYKQIRVGKHRKEFGLYKFRSMRKDADKSGQLTIGKDIRVTRSGRFIRKYKIDEFPQLLNIIFGQMSVVGPRPEVPKYVSMYSDVQLSVLEVLPGLTDYASIKYFNEQEVLGQSDNPEEKYIEEVMPEKLKLNLVYVEEASFLIDLKIIFKTMGKIVS
jgi:lipopolysaccharide/colanic/teichoic acid biosynthesis glycosyltransferase